MEFTFIPDTFNYNLASEKFTSRATFIECQIKYKNAFEKFLTKYLNLVEISQKISMTTVEIPRLLDEEYNFYHKFSGLRSCYIYVRNNYHVENLSKEDIEDLLSSDLQDDYFLRTYPSVLFEDGDRTFFGTPRPETEVNSKTITFEFAYNQIECTSLEQLNAITRIIHECFEIISRNLKESLNIEPSFVTYNGIPEQFQNENITII